MKKGFFLYTLWNSINKILGFIRNQAQMFIVGDNVISDAFFLANNVIAIVRRIFIDGSFESIFSSYFFNADDKKQFATNVLFRISGLLIISAVMLMFLSPLIGWIIGLNGDSRSYFIYFLMFLAPLIPLMFLMSFFTSLLNCYNKFEYSTPAPTFGNIFYIAIIVIFGIKYNKPLLALALGSIFYALMQVLFMIFFSRKYLQLPINKELSPQFKKDVFKGALIQFIVPVSDFFVNRMAFQYAVGSLSYLQYGYKIVHFIFSILGVSIASATTPMLSQLSTNNKEFQKSSSNIFVLTHILVIPFCILLFFFGRDMCFNVFKNISRLNNPMELSTTISILSLSLYFTIQNRVISTILIAKNLLKNSINGSVLYGVFNIVFSIFMVQSGHRGLAWAGNFAVILQFLYMFFIIVKQKLIDVNIKNLFMFFMSLLLSFLIIKVFPLLILNVKFSCKILVPVFNIMNVALPFILLYSIYLGILYFIHRLFVE